MTWVVRRLFYCEMPKPTRVYRPRPSPGRSIRAKAKKDRQKRADMCRDTEVRRFYGRRWRECALSHRSSYPACAMCWEKGKYTLPQVVDHWIPHKGDPVLFWDRTNWCPLCKKCHDGPKCRLEKAWERGLEPRARPRLVTMEMVTEFIVNGGHNVPSK